MRYLNQLNFRHIPYHTNTKKDTVPEKDKLRNVALSGCGLCCASMVVDLLTDGILPLEDCVKIAEECEASHSTGTDMKVLAPVIAEKYKLDYRMTGEAQEAVACLQTGGAVIAHVRVPAGREIGLFTKGGHYILLVAADGDEICLLDPSYTPTKFEIPERKGKVDTSRAPYLYCQLSSLHAETRAYHLFRRKR